MINVKVLGGGCAKCQTTHKLFSDVADEKGVNLQLEKVDDMQKIVAYGVMSTPAVVINEEVVHRGGVPSKEQVESWLLKS